MVVGIDDWAINELKEDGRFDEMVEQYPYWAEAGIYYFIDNEDVNEQQFLKEFEEMTGYSFYYDNPVKPDWVNE